MATKMTTKLRNAICSLASGVGNYYPSPGRFFTQLEWVLRDAGFAPHIDIHPPIHTTDGNGRMPVVLLGSDVPLFDVVYTWHQLEISNNWEMICYPSC